MSFKPISQNTNFPELEKKLLERWYKNGIVEKYLHKNDNSKEKFSFLDGPITANNPMGVHHAWGRTYKDFWQRYWNMKGRKQRFHNGFDEQGLWVEVEVEKELGLKNKQDIENLIPGDKFKSLEKFINLCKERVGKYSRIQTEQSKRLGYFMDWENSYHTSSDENNYAIWNFLKVVYEKGWLYKGRDSVPWCPRCGTAISQHEILTEEYKLLTHRTVVFKLKIKNRDNEYLLAWTTTPWTVPGNVALAVDPNLSYWKMRNQKQEIVILIDPTIKTDSEKEPLVRKFKLNEDLEKIEEIKGKDLIGLFYEAPFDHFPEVKKNLKGYTHRVVEADSQILPINPSEGTGIVHIAPGAGSEDFLLAKKEKLPVIAEIDEMGDFIDGFDFLSTKNAKDGSKLVLGDLEKRNLAFKIIDYTHRYPTCWRCKSELVWRVVDEWYISMDSPSKLKVNSKKLKVEEGKTFREQMIEVAKEIAWMPKWGLERELDWLSNMHDWLISKKRFWGLALPIWVCEKCKNFQVIGGKEELKTRAVEGWEKFEGNSPHRPWIDQVKIKCDSCQGLSSRIPDVGNPWLDAGIVPFSTMPNEWFPADFITESFPGQFKNWFYSLIAMSTALRKTNPFKRVLGFGSVRDEKGEEMHKSKGNAIEFNEAADKIGVDVMRWLYLGTNPEHNVNFGYHVSDDIRRFFHLRFWNVYNFFITYSNVDNWKPKLDPFTPANVLDKWILSRLNKTIKKATKEIEGYSAYLAVETLEDFVINDLSNWYVRRIRDRVGPTASNGQDKDNCYQTLWTTLGQISKILAPFIPFIAEEIYTNLTKEASVHLADWPEVYKNYIDESLEKEMGFARKIAEASHAQRKHEKIKLRQPLSLLTLIAPAALSSEVLAVLGEEINVKKVESKTGDFLVKLDTKITPELKREAEAREIVRRIQEERKNLGTKIDDLVDVKIDDWPKEFEQEIKRRAIIKNLIKGERFSVEKV